MPGQRECLVETIKHQPCVWGVADTVKEKEKNNFDFWSQKWP